MIATLISNGVRLAELLAEENAALSRMDLPVAARMAEPKTRAVEAFIAAEAAARRTGERVPEAERDAARALAERINDLVAANRRLLERALVAQDSLIKVLVQAAVPAPDSYDSLGAPALRAAQLGPVSLAASL